jgi:hypothetical protein
LNSLNLYDSKEPDADQIWSTNEMSQTSTKTRTSTRTAYDLVFTFLKKREVNHIDKKAGLERIRSALLQSLEKSGVGRKDPTHLLVEDAYDIEELWYLRTDVMVTIAKERGELAAKTELNSINQRFQGLLPQGLATRPSRLDD